MEEVGAQTQVASPMFKHKSVTGRFSESHPMVKKRSLPFQPSNLHQQQQQSQAQPQPQRLASGYQDSGEHWNPRGWDWDSARFIAKPSESDVPRTSTCVQMESERNRGDGNGETGNSEVLRKSPVGEDDETLSLKLGGAVVGMVEEPASSRPNKKVRSGSPGGANYPMCQVDNCKEDLSAAKDYHRRHKVCEVHSKVTQALVGKQMQRFCQQCSRFHPLSEFDEGKRSCRRRLAGHNRRRRKTQPDDVTSRVLPPGNKDNAGHGEMDIVNLLAILSRAQGNTGDGSTNGSIIPNKDQLVQILQKINSLPLPADIATKLPFTGSSNTNDRDQVQNQNKFDGNNSSISTLDLLGVLSGTPAGPSPSGHPITSERSSHGSDSEKTNSAGINQDTSPNMQGRQRTEFHSAGERSSTSYQSPMEDSDCQIQETYPHLPLQLFSSSPETDSPPKMTSSRKYFSSDSSNPIEERSPCSSPPLVQKLFPTQTSREVAKPESASTTGEVAGNVKSSKTRACHTSLDLFGGSNRGFDKGSVQSFPYQAGYTSSSGSDHSPSSLNSDAQDRSGRILFKLFDKDPSQLPGTLRTQVYNWLSQSPSEMESYIRPGCVVLSIYISMPSSAWEQLEGNLLQNVSSLVQDSDDQFWKNGRFLVHTGRQLASHLDGKVRLHNALRAWSSPELVSVSPLAVVGGQEVSILLKGRNLNTHGTKVYCTHTVEYTLKETPGSACQDSIYDEITLSNFRINTASNVLGRCFIEVDNGFRGASIPIIIAHATICQELRLLESEIDEAAELRDAIIDEHVVYSEPSRSREEILLFLNELGWLFQRKRISSMLDAPEYKLHRFKFLFIFSVERDFCALVKTLLDILHEVCIGRDELSRESLDMLLEIHLLNRAVKRRSRNMVNLLVNYSVPTDTGKVHIFPPDLVGPGGITPLHLAACALDSEAMIDTLTSDPQEIGLHSWNSLLDANGLSPHAYALMRNNHSYNKLVARKLADKKNGQVSVSIGSEIQEQSVDAGLSQRASFRLGQEQKSCSKCAVIATRYNKRITSSQGLLQRPYIHSMLAIAAVCVCVCLFLRGAPDIGRVAPFKWENLGYGSY